MRHFLKPLMTIETDYNLKDAVYLKTDAGRKEYMIISLTVSVVGITYNLASGSDTYSAYACELQKIDSSKQIGFNKERP